MAFKDFRFGAGIRIVLLGIAMAAIAFSVTTPDRYAIAILFSIVVVFQIVELYRFVSATNRKLTRFLESVKYADFISGFSADDHLGRSFKELNHAFSQVLEAFGNARSEKEEHFLYLNTIVEHVSTGLISFDTDGNVSLANATAKRFLKITMLRNLEELIERDPRLYKVLFDLPAGKSALYKPEEGDVQLSVTATEIVMRGKKIKLIALQNIRPELQKKELEAWQNLTSVLRHEIMNSITPIASLTSTLKDVLTEDLVKTDCDEYVLKEEAADDLCEGIKTIENRSKGLIRFVDAYRDYTSIPLPKVSEITVKYLFERIANLLKTEIGRARVELMLSVHPNTIRIMADEELIQQVIINLIKNAIEALSETENPRIGLTGCYNDDDSPKIMVTDNGSGIVREALEQIFVPFYTTKPTGSGIGLSLSRQIMQLHNGSLRVESEPGKGTTFALNF